MLMIPDVLLLSCGEVARYRVWPGLRELQRQKQAGRVALLDTIAECPIELIDPQEQYFQILRGCLLPLEDLAANGFLGENVLAVVCAPTEYHVLYARQLIGLVGRIAIEKPLTKSVVEARGFQQGTVGCYPYSHQLFKGKYLGFLNYCSSVAWLDGLTEIEFHLCETSGIGAR